METSAAARSGTRRTDRTGGTGGPDRTGGTRGEGRTGGTGRARRLEAAPAGAPGRAGTGHGGSPDRDRPVRHGPGPADAGTVRRLGGPRAQQHPPRPFDQRLPGRGIDGGGGATARREPAPGPAVRSAPARPAASGPGAAAGGRRDGLPDDAGGTRPGRTRHRPRLRHRRRHPEHGRSAPRVPADGPQAGAGRTPAPQALVAPLDAPAPGPATGSGARRLLPPGPAPHS